MLAVFKTRQTSYIRGFLVAYLATVSASPIVVSFENFDRGPSVSINHAGVEIAGENGALVSIVRDVGLGVSTHGSLGSIDRRIETDGPGYREGVILSVDGAINSVTLRAHLSSPTGHRLPDDFIMSTWTRRLNINSGVQYHYLEAGVVVLSLFDEVFPCFSVNLNVSSDFGFFTEYAAYLNDLPDRDSLVLEYGFSVIALEYTPSRVPDAGGTAALLAFAIAILAYFRHSKAEMRT